MDEYEFFRQYVASAGGSHAQTAELRLCLQKIRDLCAQHGWDFGVQNGWGGVYVRVARDDRQWAAPVADLGPVAALCEVGWFVQKYAQAPV